MLTDLNTTDQLREDNGVTCKAVESVFDEVVDDQCSTNIEKTLLNKLIQIVTEKKAQILV